jgi:hypothetical protein
VQQACITSPPIRLPPHWRTRRLTQEARAKLATGAAAAIGQANEEVGRAFAGYAADQIKAKAPIELREDDFYLHYQPQQQEQQQSDPAAPQPTGQQDAMFIPAGQPVPENLPPNVIVAPRDEGTLITTNPVKANEFTKAQVLGEDTIAAILGAPQANGDTPGTPAAPAAPSAPVAPANRAPAASADPTLQQEPVAPGVDDSAQVDQLLQDVPVQGAPAGAPVPVAGNPVTAPVAPVMGNPISTPINASAPEINADQPAAPAPLPDRENLADDGSRFQAFGQEMSRALKAPVDLSNVQVLETDKDPVFKHLAKALKKAFNVDVLLVNATGPVLSTDGRQLMQAFPDGSSFHGSRTIMINKAGQRSLMNTIGHELAHQLQREYPELWQELAKTALSLAKGSTKLQQHHAWLRSEGMTSLDAINEEAVSEIVGEQMGQPEFWQQVMEGKDETFVQALVSIVTKLLDKLTRALTEAGFISATKDVQVIRGAIKGAFAKWEQQNLAKEATGEQDAAQKATEKNESTVAPGAAGHAAPTAGKGTAQASGDGASKGIPPKLRLPRNQ